MVNIFTMIDNLKVVAAISNMPVFAVFPGVNVRLITWRIQNRNTDKAAFHIPLNIKNVPVLTVLAILTPLVMLGFNIYNLSTGRSGGH